MKIHLKRLKTDNLALCQKWPENRWVLEEMAHLQVPGTVCKTCIVVAVQSHPEKPAAENQQVKRSGPARKVSRVKSAGVD
jgi:hypothetical protein